MDSGSTISCIKYPTADITNFSISSTSRFQVDVFGSQLKNLRDVIGFAKLKSERVFKDRFTLIPDLLYEGILGSSILCWLGFAFGVGSSIIIDGETTESAFKYDDEKTFETPVSCVRYDAKFLCITCKDQDEVIDSTKNDRNIYLNFVKIC